jgi:hydroxymethylpyrimidine/phosphomethylpyrimidine kinase
MALGRVLIVAGSDSGGGAGIQADLKTVIALGGYGMTAITALTAQNTEGVFGVHAPPPEFITEQMRLVLDDIGADCVKIGMLHSVSVIEAVADALEAYAAGVPVVLDPVMVAKGGAPLLEADAIDAYRTRMPRLATVMTPNLPEAGALTGRTIETVDDQDSAIADIRALGAKAVLLKGGHLEGETVRDLLIEQDGVTAFVNDRIDTRHTHGTGCTLASAIATGVADGLALDQAVGRGIAYVRKAIQTAPGLGRGHGPLNHGHTVAPFQWAKSD